MLIGHINGNRIAATDADRGGDYTCPECGGVLVLKKGRKTIHHFAHKPPYDCSWAKGETQAHLLAKSVIAKAFIDRGIKTEIEFVVKTLPSHRRADVMIWSPSGLAIAIELQHTSISLDELEDRASAYARSNISQIWIPFVRPSVWSDGVALQDGAWFIEQYTARPFERWIHGFGNGAGMWMYDPKHQNLRHAKMAGHSIWVEENTYYDEYGEEHSRGGYSRWSKKWKELTLSKCYEPSEVCITSKNRKAGSLAGYNWPAGKVALFCAD